VPGQDNRCGHRFDKQYDKLPVYAQLYLGWRFLGMTDNMIDYMAKVIKEAVK
jgi:hypothetical protein